MIVSDGEAEEGAASVLDAVGDGRFQRQPMMMGEDDIERTRVALKDAPEIRRLLQRLVAD